MSFVKFSAIGPRGLNKLYKREPQTIIRNVKKLWTFYLKNLLPALTMPGDADYTKFVIIGRSRTGSNLLRGSLMSHNDIIVFGDIFRGYNINKNSSIIHWGLPYFPQAKSIAFLRQRDPVKFLETGVFEKFPGHIAAVGFKTLYPHSSPESWLPVLTYLREQKDFKIIHIKRKNILKTHLSLKKVAGRKDKWINISGVEEENTAIALDYEDCLKAFEDTRKWEEEYDAFFKDHPKLNVFYEQLSSHYETEMKRIQEFLEVREQSVTPLTYKQSKKPLSKAISNYSELKEKFLGTPWETFFKQE